MNLTSDYIDFDKALNKSISLLNDDKKFRLGFYLTVAIYTGLRISDLLRLKYIDFNNDKLVIEEKKTNKKRIITLNNQIKKAYNKLINKLDTLGIVYNEKDYIFVSQKNTVYTTQSINYILKQIFNSKKLQISSHSLRKSFGRRVYENNGQTEDALILLSDIFSHSSIAITRRYLGIRADTISNVYLSL